MLEFILLFSPKRYFNAYRCWKYLKLRGVDVGLKKNLLYYRRPKAAHRKGVY